MTDLHTKLRDLITITRTCPCCGLERSVTVTREAWIRWQEGAMIQDAFPTLTASEREILQTGICDPCWDATFDDLEDY